MSIDATPQVVLKVGMSCQGCVGAVKRVLGKHEGVDSFDIDFQTKKVTVNIKGDVDPDVILKAVAKTGKPTEIWPDEGKKEGTPEGEDAAEVKPEAEEVKVSVPEPSPTPSVVTV